MDKKSPSKRIYLSPPHLEGQENKYVLRALESGWIAPLGPEVDAFEADVCNYLNVSQAVALNTGTAALHLALKILGLKPGDHVLCPSLTFAATANAVIYERATPVFLDSALDSWVLSPEILEYSLKQMNSQGVFPKILITVDLYGQSVDYDEIISICEKRNILIIEDAAEAFGSEYNNQKCATFGRLGILSFNGNKIITTSGGGMLTGNDKGLIDKARFLSTQAREPFLHYEHAEIGYNYRMSNILAALGRGQLENLDKKVLKKRLIFDRYQAALAEINGISFPNEIPRCKSNRWLTCLQVNPEKTGTTRNKLIKILESNNIESRPVWKPMHLQPVFNDNLFFSKENNISNAENLFNNGICLPSGTNLSAEDQDRIINLLLEELK